jgi:hypothetical protein
MDTGYSERTREPALRECIEARARWDRAVGRNLVLLFEEARHSPCALHVALVLALAAAAGWLLLRTVQADAIAWYWAFLAVYAILLAYPLSWAVARAAHIRSTKA